MQVPPDSVPGTGRRPLLLSCLSAAALALAPGRVRAQGYPSRSVELVVAYAPGGATDLVARVVARGISPALGQPVAVENRGGGGTLIGTQAVERAEADGHVLLYGTNAFVNSAVLRAPAPYDPLRDFAPVGLVAVQPLGLVVRPDLKAASVGELVALAKSAPGTLNFASSGNGSGQHLAGELFGLQAGVELVHVPYRGAGPALNDLLGGRVDLMFTSLFGIMDHIQEGRLRLLATTGAHRSPAAPEAPTVAEAGVPGYAYTTWQAVFAPAGTPAAAVSRLNAALRDLGADHGFQETLAAQGLEVSTGSPADLGAMVAREAQAVADIARRTGISLS
ncbi:MAG TPA: tripartite tricarboxylate transporter substrate binding protein [Roseomonas sp.]|nr:tripartite tricarboxylate transporter substrate binding protein [Roseomonas sp.]